ncbi:MAG TPA: acyltransferase [Marinagarivorans sp.]|nr:acyltransferase [Marinagarivorans sp.]HNG60585.1 acyltransferase [Cellvibrionaceae bacterium]
MQKDTRELTALTSLRGVAAVLVVLHHYCLVFTDDIVRWLPSRILVNAYLCVDLFFMLSGFVLAYVYYSFSEGVTAPDYRRFLLARFARIYPLHLFTLGIVLALEFAALAVWLNTPSVHSHWAPPFTAEQSLLSLFSNLVMLQTLHWGAFWNVPAWSLSAEFITYLWLPWLIHALAFATIRTCIVVVALSLGCLLAIEAYFGDLGITFAGWPQIVRAGAGAALGGVAWRCYRQSLLPIISGAALLPIFGSTLLALALPLPATALMPVFFCLVLAAARNQTRPSWLFHNAFSHWLGRISFALYLVHWVVLDTLRQLSLWFTGRGLGANLGLAQELAALAGLLCLCGLLAWGLQRWVEVPARTWLVRRLN